MVNAELTDYLGQILPNHGQFFWKPDSPQFEGGIMDDVDEEQSTVVLYHSISYGFLTHSM